MDFVERLATHSEQTRCRVGIEFAVPAQARPAITFPHLLALGAGLAKTDSAPIRDIPSVHRYTTTLVRLADMHKVLCQYSMRLIESHHSFLNDTGFPPHGFHTVASLDVKGYKIVVGMKHTLKMATRGSEGRVGREIWPPNRWSWFRERVAVYCVVACCTGAIYLQVE